MIYGLMHPGSGVGNQLHRYVATRVLALDKGFEFSIIGRNNWKGKSFMDLDMGKGHEMNYEIKYPEGKIIPEHIVWEEKTNYYNPEFNFIEDNTIIDGEFQDERYLGHRMNEIDEWLKVEPIYPRTTYEDGDGVVSQLGEAPDDLCVIGFRGGEFAIFPELFLTKEYWAEAKILMLQRNINMRFEVHTDDEVLAKQFFPDYKVIHDVGFNWRSIRFAKNAIIANSSFYILPRLLQHHRNKDAFTVAPRFWARRNTKEWSMPANFYKDFQYV